MASVTALSEKVLRILDDQLDRRDWLTGDRITLADLACAPYIALAPEGKIPLESFANAIAWLQRIEAMPGFTAMPGWGD